MNIIVCVKHVPDTTEAEFDINEDGRTVKTESFPFVINEWDEYAIEEAIIKKEQLGGSVIAITVGPEDADATLRRCLAKGADQAIRLTDAAFEGSDAYALAKTLHSVIKDLSFDLVLTGAQASDDGYAQLGVMLAELLEIPHASFVKRFDVKEGGALINRELEGGMEETLEIDLPALLTIQTGINEPRYVSIMGIRRARDKEIKVLGLKDLGLRREEVGEAGSWLKIEEFHIPSPKKEAVILRGGSSDTAVQLTEILRSKGLV
ncbi:MAG: electron transfer flavoprotein subunit beta [Nitrososphaeria archaeon]|nr:electron transfer flavoprotein subunit beta [Nitrososphaeria archaeon]NIN52925.1 electron transfer flavoprotein subunit beta [Nitrososphaeria archaeon]NIQ33484.1 electron transfer flavoprotein subunit beta [Nitrososphaeria archaeon]